MTTTYLLAAALAALPFIQAAPISSNLTRRDVEPAGFGYGLTYNAFKSDSSCKYQDDVNNDFNHISGYGLIRIYGTECDQVRSVLNAVRARGMQLMAGIYDLSNSDSIASQTQDIINAASGNWNNFHTIAVGNEWVNNGGDVGQVVNAVNQVRSQLQGAGYYGPVVTVDTMNQVHDHPELCQVSDYAAINCHAFFDSSHDSSNAGNFVLGWVQSVYGACQKNTIVTESGWPHAGNANGAAVPSYYDQQQAINSLYSTFSSNLMFFDAFNDYWKGPGAFNAEPYWGILGDSPSG